MTTETVKNYRIALGLALFTIAYNVVEGLLSIFLGINDDSLTLFGFGVDSFIEVISGVGIASMVIRIRKNHGDGRTIFEKRALQVTGTAFYLLVAGLIVTAGYNGYMGHKPETTIWGVIIAVASILVMLVLMKMKISVGKKLESRAIIADAHCTRVCIYMSLVLLASSVIYELTGIGWIDILGVLGLAWLSFQEGRECFEKARSGSDCGCGKL